MDEISHFTRQLDTDNSSTPNTEQFVANGSTSTCYLMRYHGKLVFEKRLKAEFSGKEHYVANFRKEFEVGFNIDNDCIVHYIALKEDERGVFILTDYVKGLTLSDFVAKNPNYFRTSAHRKAFMAQLFSAVDCLHSHQVLHLDLKPDNVMITDVGHHVKLIDLGFCYQDGFPFGTGGTKGFSSPEQFTKAFPLSAASDIYAVGRILDFLHMAPRGIITKCTKLDPRKRYQSVEELNRAFRLRHQVKRVALFLAAVCAIAAIVLLTPLGKSGQSLSSQMLAAMGGTQSGVYGHGGSQNGIRHTMGANGDSLINGSSHSQMAFNGVKPAEGQNGSHADSTTYQGRKGKWMLTANGSKIFVDERSLDLMRKNQERQIKTQKMQSDDMAIYKKKMDIFYAPVRHFVDSPPKFDSSSKDDHYTQFSRQYKQVVAAAKQKSQNDPFCQRCRKRFNTVFENYESNFTLSIDDHYLEILHKLNNDD